MVDNLLRRAKAFIGLDEGEHLGREGSRQLDFGAAGKKDKKQHEGDGGAQIIIYEPRIYEDSLGISRELRMGNPVIINLKHLEPSEGTRLIDFVCGTAFAIDGHMIKIAESIFLFTPREVMINDIEGRGGVATVVEEEEEEEVSSDKFFSRR